MGETPQHMTGARIRPMEELIEYVNAEKKEILKYLQILAAKLGYDPLKDRTMNDVASEWISQYAPEFSRQWETRGEKPVSISYPQAPPSSRGQTAV